MKKYIERKEKHIILRSEDVPVLFAVWGLDVLFMMAGLASNSFLGGIVFGLSAFVGFPFFVWLVCSSTETRIVKIEESKG